MANPFTVLPDYSPSGSHSQVILVFIVSSQFKQASMSAVKKGLYNLPEAAPIGVAQMDSHE